MIRPDAIPVVPLGPSVRLDAAGVEALFGRGYTLRGTERVAVVRLGRDGGHAPVALGAPGTDVDALTADRLGGFDGVRVVGPCASVAAPLVRPVAACLSLPPGLRRAWGVAEPATVALGSVALEVAVRDGAVASVGVDRALWLAAGRPAAARWLPGVSWEMPAEASVSESNAITEVKRRVVTETDVRQARLRGRRIRLLPGQVVTPAAQSMAREWNVFEPSSTADAPTSGRRR